MISCPNLPPPHVASCIGRYPFQKKKKKSLPFLLTLPPSKTNIHTEQTASDIFYYYYFLKNIHRHWPTCHESYPTQANIHFFPTGNTRKGNTRKGNEIRDTPPHNYNILDFLLTQHFMNFATKAPENTEILNAKCYRWHTSIAVFHKIYLLFVTCISSSLRLKWLFLTFTDDY